MRPGRAQSRHAPGPRGETDCGGGRRVQSAASRAGGRRERGGGPEAGRACFQHGQWGPCGALGRPTLSYPDPCPGSATVQHRRLLSHSASRPLTSGFYRVGNRTPRVRPGRSREQARRERGVSGRQGARCQPAFSAAESAVQSAHGKRALPYGRRWEKSRCPRPATLPSALPGGQLQGMLSRKARAFLKHKTDSHAHSLASQSLQACSSWARGDVPDPSVSSTVRAVIPASPRSWACPLMPHLQRVPCGSRKSGQVGVGD